MLDLSIIIVNWNTRDLLAKCLRDVETTIKNISYETWVVDNASGDGSPEMVRRDFPNVRLIANTENVGFARANNQAMQAAEGRYILLLNSDAFVKERTIDHMVAFLDERPEAGLAGCKLLYEDGRLQPSCYRLPTLWSELVIAFGLDKLFPKSPLFGGYAMTDWDYGDVREVDVIMGAFMLARAEAVRQVGLMDESFFMYSEEVDWCYRFKQAGWKVYFTPEVETVHLWGGSSRAVKVETLLRLYRSRVHFFRKHYGRPAAALYKIILGINCLIRVVPGALYYLPRPVSRSKHAAFRQLLRALPGF
ncbi:MAG: glycosyltransferase family 2 protein [Chloroflexi bacterium]|nr:glycosyltransferase family 2 protein [Chloroflexota bacterium]MDL1885795.1 glycosyltransferase family 2 protein [Anaerolineae bacterium CFX8]